MTNIVVLVLVAFICLNILDGVRTEGYTNALEKRVHELVNEERAKVGLKPLFFNPMLRVAAYKHSLDMQENNYLDHNSRDGTKYFQRIRAAGYIGSATAENIAKGQTTAEEVMRSWMGSPPHRANILGGYKELGVGLSGASWTQCFGSRTAQCGNFVVDYETGETCDDGNNISGDGCFNCAIEPGSNYKPNPLDPGTPGVAGDGDGDGGDAGNGLPGMAVAGIIVGCLIILIGGIVAASFVLGISITPREEV
eukprot:TRINITY_DN1322_c0_g1_i1.p1 TRINITY_DN1322_c0_g1~~TRINITY_DN1322_c0_g1_i1.p1  ORF type:complete len:252 (+),score=65.47 TRINITY_DN1322_c0_g1_i1:53-808(+)